MASAVRVTGSRRARATSGGSSVSTIAGRSASRERSGERTIGSTPSANASSAAKRPSLTRTSRSTSVVANTRAAVPDTLASRSSAASARCASAESRCTSSTITAAAAACCTSAARSACVPSSRAARAMIGPPPAKNWMAHATSVARVPRSPTSSTGRSLSVARRASAAAAAVNKGGSSQRRCAAAVASDGTVRGGGRNSARTRARSMDGSNGWIMNSTRCPGGARACGSISSAAFSKRSGASGASRARNAAVAASSRGPGGAPKITSSGAVPGATVSQDDASDTACSPPSTMRRVSLVVLEESMIRIAAIGRRRVRRRESGQGGEGHERLRRDRVDREYPDRKRRGERGVHHERRRCHVHVNPSTHASCTILYVAPVEGVKENRAVRRRVTAARRRS